MNTQNLKNLLTKTKEAASILAKLSTKQKNEALSQMQKALQDSEEEIFAANKIDIARAKENGKSAAFIDRLTLTPKSFEEMLSQIEQVTSLPDPVGEHIEKRILPNKVELEKVRVP